MHRTRAMTLLEVMFALALLVVLGLGVGSFYFEMTSRRDRLVHMATQQRDVSLFLDRVENALLSALAVAPDGSAGVDGDATSLTVVTRAVQANLEDDASLADACTVGFAFDESGERCTQTVSAGDRSIDDAVLTLVERLRFRYSNGKQWSSGFNSISKHGLPVAVEVSVWFAPHQRPGDVAGEAFPPEDGGLSEEALEEQFGPMDMPEPEPEEDIWAPREPDHVRVISIPDAPEWQEREL